MAATSVIKADDFMRLQAQVDQMKERLDFVGPMLPLLNYVQDVECEASVQLLRMRNAQVVNQQHQDIDGDANSAHLETVRWLHIMTDVVMALHNSGLRLTMQGGSETLESVPEPLNASVPSSGPAPVLSPMLVKPAPGSHLPLDAAETASWHSVSPAHAETAPWRNQRQCARAPTRSGVRGLDTTNLFVEGDQTRLAENQRSNEYSRLGDVFTGSAFAADHAMASLAEERRQWHTDSRFDEFLLGRRDQPENRFRDPSSPKKSPDAPAAQRRCEPPRSVCWRRGPFWLHLG